MKDLRVHVTVSPNIRRKIQRLARRRRTSVSSIASELIERALENEEELWLAQLVEESETESKGKPRTPADEVWKKLDIE
jgi:predicted transcriptional regulator